MLFNSFEYALFLPLVFALYWGLFHKNLRIQNVFLIIASYVFYGFWDWRFLGLIFFSSLVDFTIGRQMGATEDEIKRKYLLWASLTVNLGLLAVFKYFNFFAESLVDLFGLFNMELDYVTLKIILPVGISFYTFQTLSYTIDIYRKQLEPTQDPIAFFAFVSFFPQLVAGPIERARNLLPQFLKNRAFSYEKAADGSRQILWGLFKKVVIADNCAVFVNDIFANYESQPGIILAIGAFLFAFQVYADFSGYSDIAIGTAKLFGFQLMQNFRAPYFSKNHGEFWRRWHISLSTWILDYVYNPLVIAIRQWKQYGVMAALVITFVLNGLWHGASWHFVVFGFFAGLILAYEAASKKLRKRVRKATNKDLYYWVSVFFTFTTWCFIIVLFRAETVPQAFGYYKSMFANSFLPANIMVLMKFKFIMFFIALLLVFDWIYRNEEHNLTLSNLKNGFLRRGIYLTLFLMIMLFAGKQEDFIYFQF